MFRRLALLFAALALTGAASTAFAQAPTTTAPPEGVPGTTVPPTTAPPADDEGTAGGPTITATPSTGLVEGQVVRVTGSGFQGFGGDWPIHLCALPAGGLATDCEQIGLATIDDRGVDGSFAADRYINRGTVIDCAVVACGAVMEDTTGELAVAPLSFASVIAASPGFTG